MRCLFIGLDAFDPELLRDGARRGDFPVLAKLLADGRAIETTADPGTYVGSLWPTIHTGVDPSRHGIFTWQELQPGSYESQICDERNIGAPSFWSRLSRAGHRVAVVDVPLCKLDPDINGVHVVNWLTHFKTIEGFATAPANLASELEARYGLDPVPNCDEIDHGDAGREVFTEALLRRVDHRTDYVLGLIESKSYDQVTVVYGESHCVGHQCYDLHLAKGDAPDNPVMRVYRAIDRAVGRLMEARPEGCSVLLLASHGIGPQFDGNHLADRLVRKVDQRLDGGRPIPLSRRVLDGIEANRLRRFLGPLANFLPALSRRAHARAFTVTNSNAALGIRVNLVGREPAGLVEADDYDSYLDALQAKLMTARRPDDGSPAFTEAVRPTVLYGTDPMDNKLPDLMLSWDRSREYSTLEVPGMARITGYPVTVRTGDHREGGLAVFLGPDRHNAGLTGPMNSGAIAHHILAMFDIETRDAPLIARP
jgi:predicted AlkP superfamily phosphohydrolase/phosphomutase